MKGLAVSSFYMIDWREVEEKEVGNNLIFYIEEVCCKESFLVCKPHSNKKIGAILNLGLKTIKTPD